MTATLPLLHKQERRLISEELRRCACGDSQSMAQFATAFTADRPVDRVALTRAFNAAVAKHSALRTVFVRSSQYDAAVRQLQLQTFARTGLYIPGMYEQRAVEHVEVEVSEREWSGDYEELEALARQECAVYLDLGTAPALRATLMAGERQHVVIVNLSHMVLDRWAVTLLHREVVHAYAAFIAGASWDTPQVLQHHDLVADELAMLRSPEGEQHLAYWSAQYGSLDDALIKASELPFVNPRATPPTFEALRLSLSEEDLRSVREACGGTPDYAFWRTMYGIALGILVNKTRVAFTANFFNRRRPGAQNALAWCAHAHMLAVDAPWSRAWAEVWRQVRSGIRQAQAHEGYSWDSAAQRLARPIGATNTFLTFDFVPSPSSYADAPLKPTVAPGSVLAADLGVRVHQVNDSYTLVSTFNSGRYQADGVSHLLTLLHETIRSCAAQPGGKVGDIVRAVRQRQRQNQRLWRLEE